MQGRAWEGLGGRTSTALLLTVIPGAPNSIVHFDKIPKACLCTVKFTSVTRAQGRSVRKQPRPSGAHPTSQELLLGPGSRARRELLPRGPGQAHAHSGEGTFGSVAPIQREAPETRALQDTGPLEGGDSANGPLFMRTQPPAGQEASSRDPGNPGKARPSRLLGPPAPHQG